MRRVGRTVLLRDADGSPQDMDDFDPEGDWNRLVAVNFGLAHLGSSLPALRVEVKDRHVPDREQILRLGSDESRSEQLAMVSVVQREWAVKNPRATFKAPITVEDVLNSQMIAYPFRLLQCCLVTDGGGALILVAAE